MNCATHSDTAAVAFCRTCGKPLCNQCTRDVRGVIYCEACLAARMEGTAPAAGFTPVQVPPQSSAVSPPSCIMSVQCKGTHRWATQVSPTALHSDGELHSTHFPLPSQIFSPIAPVQGVIASAFP